MESTWAGRLVGLSIALGVLAPTSAAVAAETPLTCANDAEKGQELRDASKLLAARDLFIRCAQPSCPGAVQKECVRWLEDVSSRIPTIVPSARDDHGSELLGVRVMLDGVPLTAAIGTAVAVDPGPHTLSFEASSSSLSAAPRAGKTNKARVDVVVHEGDHARLITATLSDSASPPPEPAAASSLAASSPREATPSNQARSGIPASAIVIGALSVVGLGTWATLGTIGALDYGRLKDRCGSDCAPSDVSRVRNELLASSIGLGVGLAAAAATVIIVVVDRSHRATAAIAPTWAAGTFGFSARASFD